MLSNSARRWEDLGFFFPTHTKILTKKSPQVGELPGKSFVLSDRVKAFRAGLHCTSQQIHLYLVLLH